jgi:acetyltransferase-like isoleucine patch superfamily enzyme
VIGENSIIAAGSVVLSGTVVEPGSIYGGVPAKRLKEVDPQQTADMINRITDDYIMYAGWFME